MPRSKNVDSWMSEQDPSIRQIAETVRNIVLNAEPQLREAVKWSNPVYESKGKIAYISATDAYVNLGFFNGAALADPAGKIEGTGKSMRHVKIRSVKDLDADQVTAWVSQAVLLDAADPK